MASRPRPAYRGCGTKSFHSRMSRRLTPPIHLLRAFVATARMGTVSSASVALHLTQGAVSKQVHELEAWLGVALFSRVRRRLQLTPEGQRYLLAIEPLLAQLQSTTLELLTGGGSSGALHVSSLPT